MTEPLLEVTALHKRFKLPGQLLAKPRYVNAVNDVSLTIKRGETLGLVGESGSGKSTLGQCVLRLIEPDSGALTFDGHDVMAMNNKQLRRFRRDAQFIFQDPYSSLNPKMRVDQIVAEGIDVHRLATGAEREARIFELLELVGLDRGAAARFPHQFSGGQRQRIGIARALAVKPTLIIADEPTSALDVSVQAQIVNLLLDLQTELGLSYLFITHDLELVRVIADRIAVMYNGRIVECAPSDQLFSDPQHAYTRTLLAAIPGSTRSFEPIAR